MKKKIGTLIVDDDELERRRLHRLLGSDPDIEILGECGSGSEAVAAIHAQGPDLVFLDVEMPPGIDAFGVLEAISREKMPLVIFVTGYNQYALRALAAHPIDYLLKPYDDSRFLAALAEAKLSLRTKQYAAMYESMLEELRSGSAGAAAPDPRAAVERPLEGAYDEYLVVVENGRERFIDVVNLNWVKADGKETILHVEGEGNLLHYESISDLAKRLNPKIFFRIHRSYLVNRRYIKEMSRLTRRRWRVILRDREGTEVKMSDSRHRRLFEGR
jgi:two-component system LytT family response regulator